MKFQHLLEETNKQTTKKNLYAFPIPCKLAFCQVLGLSVNVDSWAVSECFSEPCFRSLFRRTARHKTLRPNYTSFLSLASWSLNTNLQLHTKEHMGAGRVGVGMRQNSLGPAQCLLWEKVAFPCKDKKSRPSRRCSRSGGNVRFLAKKKKALTHGISSLKGE